MSFEGILEKMVSDCSGAVGVALMGNDGIAVAEFTCDTDDIGELSEGASAAGIEFGRILDEIRKASDGINGGRLEESLVGLERYWLLFRVVDEEFFLVMALLPSGNIGKARYLLRRHLALLRAEL